MPRLPLSEHAGEAPAPRQHQLELDVDEDLDESVNLNPSPEHVLPVVAQSGEAAHELDPAANPPNSAHAYFEVVALRPSQENKALPLAPAASSKLGPGDVAKALEQRLSPSVPKCLWIHKGHEAEQLAHVVLHRRAGEQSAVRRPERSERGRGRRGGDGGASARGAAGRPDRPDRLVAPRRPSWSRDGAADVRDASEARQPDGQVEGALVPAQVKSN